VKAKRRFLDIAILGNLYVVVCWSVFYEVSELGYWMISLIAAVIIGVILDRSMLKARDLSRIYSLP